MTPTERQELITSKLNEALTPDVLEVINESHLHIGHAGSQTGASHFAIKIKANALNGLNKVKQHQKIYEVVGFLIPEEVHALRIIIL